jgi:Ca2+-binding EF-hand superfamily protein
MKSSTKFALMLGAAVLIGGSTLALAQMDGPPPPDGPMQGLMHRERLSDRLLADFDTNRDGKVTHAEFNNVLGSRFAAVTHGAKLMSADQFLMLHQADFAKHATAMFRRVDWNGDGKLTLDEFVAPQRAHFEMMDRDGSGTVSCSPFQHADFRSDEHAPDGAGPREHARWRGRADGHGPGGRFGGHGFGGFGLSRFCSNADVSRDGTVTRAEFDSVTTKEFSGATNGAPTMTLAQFTQEEFNRYRDTNAKMFKRLDKDGDGKLTLAEFAAPLERMFDRLDRNHDGVITADEMKPHFGGRDRGERRHGGGDGDDQSPERDN